jgi:hypothetical protein
MGTVLIDTTDLGEAEEVLSANYAKVRISAPAGALTIDDVSYSYNMSFDTEPIANIVLCRVHAGHHRATITRRPSGGVWPGSSGCDLCT